MWSFQRWLYKKIILGIGLCFLGFFSTGSAQNHDYCDSGNLSQKAFCEANNRKQIFDLGNNSRAVGNRFFLGGRTLSIQREDGSRDISNSYQESTVVRITKFLLTMTIVLSVTMIIFNGMQYIIKSGSGEDPKKAQTNLVYIVVGIIIALSSVVLINLFQSAGKTLYNAAGPVSSTLPKNNTSLS